MTRLILVVLCYLASGISADLIGQECGTNVSPEHVVHIDELMSNSKVLNRSGRTNNVLVDIPVTFNFITRDDGTGGVSEVGASNILSQLNGYYAPTGMRFVLDEGVNFIANSDFFDFDAADEGAVAVSNDVPGKINIYFFNSLVSGGTPLCGYTRFPPSSDRVFVRYSCVTGGNTTLEHELGHYFTLFHTHGTTNTGTTDELVNQSNCTSAGDRICDTEADPNLSGVVNAACAYTGTLKDINGDSYTPNTRNIMSYSRDECQDLFTTGQYDRMRSGFENSRAYLNFVSENFIANFVADTREECVESTIDFTGIGFGVTSWSWEFEGGTPATSSLETPSVTYNTGGEFNVTLTVTGNGGETVVVNKTNYITIVDPLANASTGEFETSIDNSIPGELNINNPDQGFTFEFSSIDVDDDSNSGSIVVRNYDYFTENLGNEDNLELNFFNTIGVAKYDISFDYAYTYRLGGDIVDGRITSPVYDSLFFVANTGCSPTDIPLFSAGGESLATAAARNNSFVPLSSDWRTEELELVVEADIEAYLFKLRSKSFNGNNLYIDNLSIIPDYSVESPSNFRASDISSNSVTLRWIDNSSNELSFIIERSKDNGEFVQLTEVNPDVLSFVDNDITSGSQYTYRLFAQGFADNRSEFSDIVEVNNFLVTSIDPDNDGINEFEFYPNPVKSFATFRFREPLREDYSVEIYNISGARFTDCNHTLTRTINQDELKADMSSLQPGFYLMLIKSGNMFYNIKIIKE